MLDALKRKGLIAQLEEELAAVELRLKGIAGSISDAIFPIRSHLDTDGRAVAQYGREYLECQLQGQKIRARLEELKNS